MKFNTYLGRKIEGAYEKYLEASRNRSESQEQEVSTSLEGIDKGNYIYLPQHKLYVAKQRSHLGKNWREAHKLLYQENARMLTIREFVDFLKTLKAGNQEFKIVYNDIIELRKKVRAEWLDADFKYVGNKMYIHSNHRIVNSMLQPQKLEPLEECLMENRIPGIDLESWLQNATNQGLPHANIKKEDLYYWAPIKDNNSVARFVAGSDRVGLYCYGYPEGSNSSLGVRAAKIKV